MAPRAVALRQTSPPENGRRELSDRRKRDEADGGQGVHLTER